MIDFTKIEQYRENKRIKAKKAPGGLSKSIGKSTPPLPTPTAVLSCWAWWNWTINPSTQ